MAMIFCRGCGKEMHETAHACPSCGAPQTTTSGSSQKSQTVAGFLCFFLGGIGVHRFYLGKIVTGILYLLFSWTFIPAIIACIEVIIIAFTSPERWAEKYNYNKPTPPAHWTIKLLAVLAPLVFATALLSAIALPAYQDYVTKAEQAQMQNEHNRNNESEF